MRQIVSLSDICITIPSPHKEPTLNTPTTPSAPLERPTPLLRLVTLRIIPFLLLCWLMAFIDRVNIGFAQLQIKQDLGFGDAVYGLGAGIFFIGYVLFEVPSNIYLEKIGARKTFSRIMICWGVTSSLTMLIRTPEHFYIMRFLLGACEAGFFPGLVFYLSCWFPESYRARVISWFFVTSAFSGIVGGMMSGTIMHYLDGAYGLRGWQWMFMMEGIPSIILGIVAIFYLDDSIDKARWLDAGQKVELKELLRPEVSRKPEKIRFRDLFGDPYVYILAIAYFTLNSGNFGFGFWLPTILKDFGIRDPFMIGMWSAVPYAIGSIGIAIISGSSDRRQERRWHLLACTVFGGLALASLTLHVQAFWLVILQLTVAIAFMYGSMPLFWAVPFKELNTKALAGKIALVSSLGQLGGFAAPYALGLIKAATGRLDTGLIGLGALFAAGGVLVWITARSHRRASATFPAQSLVTAENPET